MFTIIINIVCYCVTLYAGTEGVSDVVAENEPQSNATMTTPSKKDKTDTLDVETLLMKQCHVCVTPLESIVFHEPLSKGI